MTHITLSFRPVAVSIKRRQNNPNLVEVILEGLDHKVTVELPREALDQIVTDVRDIEDKEDEESRRQMALFVRMGEPL